MFCIWFVLKEQTGATSSSVLYLSAGALHQGLGYRVEVGFTAKEPVEKHQGGALPFPVEDVVGQADGAADRWEQ